MRYPHRSRMTHLPRYLLLAAGLALVTGCRKPEIHSYVAPRDATLDNLAPAPGSEPLPQLSWSLPPGWEETKGGQMSVASFAIDDPNGGASVAITPMPNLAGREDAIVNMWREQVQLGPLSPEEMAKALEPVPVADSEGRIFEIAGTREGKPIRTIAAMLHRGPQSWFFKMSGDDAVATAHKAQFVEFLKSLRFSAGAPTASAPAPASAPSSSAPAAAPAASASAGFKWAVPPAWQTSPIGQMQVAKFAVPAQGEAKADVTVSIFPGDTGGTLANVNRWRRQLGMEETDDAGLAQCTQPIEGASGAVLADLKHEKRAMLGAIVPRGGEYYFYKLTGDEAAVAAAREDFLGFVRSSP